MEFLLNFLLLTIESIRTLKVRIDKHYKFTFYPIQIIRMLTSSTCSEIDGGHSFGDGHERMKEKREMFIDVLKRREILSEEFVDFLSRETRPQIPTF